MRPRHVAAVAVAAAGGQLPEPSPLPPGPLPNQRSCHASKPHASKPHVSQPHASKPHASKPHAGRPCFPPGLTGVSTSRKPLASSIRRMVLIALLRWGGGGQEVGVRVGRRWRHSSNNRAVGERHQQARATAPPPLGSTLRPPRHGSWEGARDASSRQARRQQRHQLCHQLRHQLPLLAPPPPQPAPAPPQRPPPACPPLNLRALRVSTTPGVTSMSRYRRRYRASTSVSPCHLSGSGSRLFVSTCSPKGGRWG